MATIDLSKLTEHLARLELLAAAEQGWRDGFRSEPHIDGWKEHMLWGRRHSLKLFVEPRVYVEATIRLFAVEDPGGTVPIADYHLDAELDGGVFDDWLIGRLTRAAFLELWRG